VYLWVACSGLLGVCGRCLLWRCFLFVGCLFGLRWFLFGGFLGLVFACWVLFTFVCFVEVYMIAELVCLLFGLMVGGL